MREQVSFAQAMAGTLVLVNPSHPLQVWPGADELAPALSAPNILLRRQAATMLAALVQAVGGGGQILPVSGYRTHQEQQTLYADCLRENGAEFTRTYVALPGCSEHETGLAIDVGEAREEVDFIRPAFPDTGVCGRFQQLAARYGYVLRYPAGAESITRIGHEPWHFRYVGWPHAALLVGNGGTLEEYVAYLQNYTPAKPLHARAEGRAFTVFRVPLSKEGACFDVPAGRIWQASADNSGGLVVTLWGAA